MVAPGTRAQEALTLAEGVRAASVILWPFMPGVCSRALQAMGADGWAPMLTDAAWGRAAGATVVPLETQLFPRIDQ